MNASTSAPGSSGDCPASRARNSRLACRAGRRWCKSAGANRAWTGHGRLRTGRSSRRAAGPCPQSSPRPRPSRRPGKGLSGDCSPRMPRPRGRAPRAVPAARTAPPGPQGAPARRATRDSGHRTPRGSARGDETIALARCPLGMGDGSVENYHHPSSEGTFRVAAPETTLNSPVD